MMFGYSIEKAEDGTYEVWQGNDLMDDDMTEEEAMELYCELVESYNYYLRGHCL